MSEQLDTVGFSNPKSRFSNFFKPGNDLLGYTLFLTSMILWFEGNNLRSLTIFLAIIAFFWFVVNLLAKTKLFSKKETDLENPSTKRKLKTLSFILVILVALLVSTTTIVLNIAEDFGGEPVSHDSPNYNDGTFENSETTSLQSGEVSSWDLLGEYMVSDNCRSPNEDLPSEKFELIDLENDEISVTWFGHSTILMRSNNVTIITDPVFSDAGAGPLSLGPSPFPYEHSYNLDDLPEIDYVFISHDHYDHLDMNTVKKLEDSMFFVPLGIKNHLLEWDIEDEHVQELDWYDEVNISQDLHAALTPARHFSGRGLTDSHSTLWGSWVFNLHDTSIYFSGDTGYTDEFTNISEKFGPFDIAFLDSGQYNIAWQQVHMLPEQVIQAGIDLNASLVLPIHISKYELALHHWYEPMELVSTLGAERNVSVATPILGSSFIIGDEIPNEAWWRGVSECTEPFLDEHPILEYTLIYTGLIGILWVAIPRFKNRNKHSEEE
ncbi:MAG: MBL fold metallo-hydrolase [Candidatus Poseidoniaceae archaeon]|nr:MBL fold metallo-hydrolase [Candidatus Poseidoniaceae archaeon]